MKKESSQEYLLGAVYGYTAACRDLDDGIDPRTREIPDFIEEAKHPKTMGDIS